MVRYHHKTEKQTETPYRRHVFILYSTKVTSTERNFFFFQDL